MCDLGVGGTQCPGVDRVIRDRGIGRREHGVHQGMVRHAVAKARWQPSQTSARGQRRITHRSLQRGRDGGTAVKQRGDGGPGVARLDGVVRRHLERLCRRGAQARGQVGEVRAGGERRVAVDRLQLRSHGVCAVQGLADGCPGVAGLDGVVRRDRDDGAERVGQAKRQRTDDRVIIDAPIECERRIAQRRLQFVGHGRRAVECRGERCPGVTARLVKAVLVVHKSIGVNARRGAVGLLPDHLHVAGAIDGDARCRGDVVGPRFEGLGRGPEPSSC